VLLGGAGLLKVKTTLVDGCDGVELVDLGIDTEVLPRSEGKMFDLFDI
jgi:hypothetical protein